ncbi:hypothetical protein [Flaviaesturariibacter amylovorans]|uniref:O-antigen ligase domain-containing protein n=1 Tax=Flaviaesturariibacter amylovorans TaxID=1084520 RepID=A0ABP8HEN8_9BACT
MHPPAAAWRAQLNKIDPLLLLFLILLLNVKLVVKLLALALVCLLRPHFRFGFREGRLPLFYPAIIGLAVIGALVNGSFGAPNYGYAFATGIAFWGAALLAIHQLKGFTERNSDARLHRTLLVFFVLNALVSWGTLAGIILETGALNPYRYQGDFQKYFINTGDHIRGLSFDTSTTNAAINAAAVLYFYGRRHWWPMALCLGTLLLAGSNLVNAALLGCFVFLFCFRSDRTQKSILAGCCLPMIVFWARVSPQNNDYIGKILSGTLGVSRPHAPAAKPVPIWERPDSSLTSDERRQKRARLYLDSLGSGILQELRTAPPAPAVSATLAAVAEKPALPEANIHTAPYQHKDDTSTERRQWMQFAATALPAATAAAPAPSRLPGKLRALQQTASHLAAHPALLLFGAGTGRWSSKLAFRATGLRIAGAYPQRLTYIDPAFREGHLALHLSYFTRSEYLHSVIHTPNSVYDQLAGEYGLPGVAAFLLLYAGFFLRKWRRLTYGLSLLLLASVLIGTDYWFEQLSLLPLLELLLFLDLKTTAHDAA